MKSIAGAALVLGAAVMLSGCVGAGDRTMEQGAFEEQSDIPPIPTGDQPRKLHEQWERDLAAGKKMRCRYTMKDESGKESTVQMTMEKERYRMEMGPAGASYVMVSDGKTSYNWMSGEKTGMKMDQACMDELGQGTPADTPVSDSVPEFDTPTDALTNAPDISCAEAPDADFSIPGDIVFTDQCAMLKEQLKLMEQYQREMPAGLPGAGSMPGVPMPR